MNRYSRSNSHSCDRIDPYVLSQIAARQNVPENCNCQHDDEAETEFANKFDFSLAMLYSPYQQFQNLYSEEEGFVAGTIFKELDKTFYGPKCSRGMCNE